MLDLKPAENPVIMVTIEIFTWGVMGKITKFSQSKIILAKLKSDASHRCSTATEEIKRLFSVKNKLRRKA